MKKDFGLSPSKFAAAYILSDEVYELLRAADLGGNILSEIYDVVGDCEDLDFSHPERMAAVISTAAWKLELLTDYLTLVRTGLQELDDAARSHSSISCGEPADFLQSEEMVSGESETRDGK